LLGSKKNITYAKCEISKFLNPEGVVIIPANDPFLEKTLKEFWKGRVIKVRLLNIANQKESIEKDDNLRGFYNPSNKILEKSLVIDDLWKQGRIFSLKLLLGSSCVGILLAMICGSIVFFIYKIKSKR